MADDKSKQGAADRALVAGGETYEVDYFADKHGLSRAEAQSLIDRIGNNREKLDAAAAGGASKKMRTRRSRPPLDKPTGSTTRRRASAPKAASTQSTVKPRAKATPGIAALAAPVAAAVAPVTARVEAVGKNAVSATRRRATSVRRSAKKAPVRAKRAASAAVASAKSTGKGRAAQLVGAAAAGLVTGLAVNIARKVAVQAPSAWTGDWLEALKLEHRMALALFDKLQATDNSETGKRTALLTQLKHALGKHAFTEENVVYPALRDWGDKADADKLNHDHGYVKQHLYDLDGMANDAPGFLARVARFREDLEAHIREEEDSIFPPLHASLGEAGNAKVTALANKEAFKLA